MTVQPQVSGIITQIQFKEGQIVAKGQTLATLDPRPFQTALDQARGALARDEAQLQVAQLTLERLQRRPDIAAAERRVAAANAQIGVAQAAFFPLVTLSGTYGGGAADVAKLFDASASLWSVGAELAETVFDAGARSARVEQARAGYDQAVAEYRQTTLAAFQNVEDQLAGARILEQQMALLAQASEAADQAERIGLNQYEAGLVAYTNVVILQAAALSARTALAQAERNRQTTAVALIQALGGGWTEEALVRP